MKPKQLIEQGIIWQEGNLWYYRCAQCHSPKSHDGKSAKTNCVDCYRKKRTCLTCRVRNEKQSIENNIESGNLFQDPLTKKWGIKCKQCGSNRWLYSMKKAHDYLNQKVTLCNECAVANALAKSNWIKVRMDMGQQELIDKWNRLGFKFETNYQLHRGKDLFYLDGYDKEHNVVLEFDSKYHNIPSQLKRDFIRQQKIIDILTPKKFWRYNSVKKQCENVLGDK